MPCRNAHAGFQRESLESVVAQTIESWELLLVDDASDDPRTLDVLEELARRGDPRVRAAASASRHVTGAVNAGMRLARTHFVCTLPD
jgi:glycosyltransferase involved in cell wall biosynthesis